MSSPDKDSVGCLKKLGLISIALSGVFIWLFHETKWDLFMYCFIGTSFLMMIGLFGANHLENKPKPRSTPQRTGRVPAISIPAKTRFGMSDSEFKLDIENQLSSYESKPTSIYWVGDEHRTHPWSLRPGGCTVVVLFDDGECRGYDKVKRPHKYLPKIANDYISNFRSNVRHETLEDYIKSLYAVKEGQVKLSLVWSKGNRNSPWDLLERYKTE